MEHKDILIVTPHPDFGELICQSLENDANFLVSVVQPSAKVKPYKKTLDYVLLDMEMGIGNTLEQGLMIRNQHAMTSLVLISRKQPPPEMDILQPWVYLHKPFTRKDLIRILNGENTVQPAPAAAFTPRSRSVPGNPIWRMAAPQVNDLLHDVTSGLDAHATILITDKSVLAHTGSLSATAVDECSLVVQKYLGASSGAELFKPVSLQCTNQRLLIHATILAVGIILAMAFDENTPFDVIRSQNRYMKSILTYPQLPPPSVKTLASLPELEDGSIKQLETPALVADEESATEVDSFLLERILTHTEPPDPVVLPRVQEVENSQEAANADLHEEMVDLARRNLSTARMQAETTQAAERGQKMESAQVGQEKDRSFDPSVYRQRSYLFMDESQSDGRVKAADPYRAPESQSISKSGLVEVHYSCVLVPRLRSQRLEGDPVVLLEEQLPELFVAYGWRLDRLMIDPNYLQWIGHVPPSISPAAHIRIVRKHSSRMLLENFTRFRRGEYLHDFWSPGYLLGSGGKPLSVQEITAYILTNRSEYYADLPSTRKV